MVCLWTLWTDADGAFRSHFEDYLNNNDVFAGYIPAEAHHRLGLIERHNATPRSILERVIDAQAVSGPEQLDLAITAAIFAKNSDTWSSGRPPFIAAFGRIPRHGLNLLSDQHGLVFGGSREYQQQLADVLLAEAQQHMASMAVDSSFRRALLKKTQDQAARLHLDQASWVASWLLALDCAVRQEQRWLPACSSSGQGSRWKELLVAVWNQHYQSGSASVETGLWLRAVGTRSTRSTASERCFRQRSSW